MEKAVTQFLIFAGGAGLTAPFTLDISSNFGVQLTDYVN